MKTSTQKGPLLRIDSLQKIQENFSKRIDNACDKLLDSFEKILYAAHVQFYFQFCEYFLRIYQFFLFSNRLMIELLLLEKIFKSIFIRLAWFVSKDINISVRIFER
jgi:hypothetical protein